MDRLDKLKKVVGPVPEVKATYRIYSIERRFPEHIEVYLPKIPVKKLVPGMEAQKKKKPHTDPKENTEADKLLSQIRSVRRTRKRVREIVLCNEFDLFVTFTFKSERDDIQKCQAKMSTWLKNQNRNISFEYLIIPELHKNGALHFHGLLKNYRGNLVDSGKQTRHGQPIYNIKSYRNGFTTAVKIPPKDIGRVGNYVSKYITKDMPRFKGKKRYWSSKNLKEPIRIENSRPWFIEIKPSAEKSNIWGRIMYFTIGRKYES